MNHEHSTILAGSSRTPLSDTFIRSTSYVVFGCRGHLSGVNTGAMGFSILWLTSPSSSITNSCTISLASGRFRQEAMDAMGIENS
jgi:hypothetical protein